MSGLAPMGHVAGPSNLLQGLGALANAVPAYFQGRELAEQEQDRKRAIAAQTLPFLQQRLAANASDPDAIKSLGQVYATLGLGSVPMVPGQTPEAPPVAPDAPINTVPTKNLAAYLENPKTAGPLEGTPTIRVPGPAEVDLGAIGAAPTAQSFIASHLQEFTQMPPEERNAQSIAAFLKAAGVQPTDQNVQDILNLPFVPDEATQTKFLGDFTKGLGDAAKLGPGAVTAYIHSQSPIAQRLGVGDLSQYLSPEMLDGITQQYQAGVDKLRSEGLINNVRAKVLLDEAPSVIRKNLADTNLANTHAETAVETVNIANQRLGIAIAREQREQAKDAATAAALPNSPAGRAQANSMLNQWRADARLAQTQINDALSGIKKLDPQGLSQLAGATESPALKALYAQKQQAETLLQHRQASINGLEQKIASGAGLNLPPYVHPVPKPKTVTPHAKTAPTVIRQKSKSGKPIYSTDGGSTWNYGTGP